MRLSRVRQALVYLSSHLADPAPCPRSRADGLAWPIDSARPSRNRPPKGKPVPARRSGSWRTASPVSRDRRRCLLTIQSFQASQQLADAAAMPLAAPCRPQPSFVQRARDGTQGDDALFPKLANGRGQSLGSRIRGAPGCQLAVAPAVAQRDQAQASEHHQNRGCLPSSASGRRYSPSVQLFRQRPVRQVAFRLQLANGRDQSRRAAAGRRLIGQSTPYSARAEGGFRVFAFHGTIVADPRGAAPW